MHLTPTARETPTSIGRKEHKFLMGINPKKKLAGRKK